MADIDDRIPNLKNRLRRDDRIPNLKNRLRRYAPVLPDYPGLPRPIARKINRTARNDITESFLTVAGGGAFVPVIYGQPRVGAILAKVTVYSGYLTMILVWGVGEVESIEGIYNLDGSTPDNSIEFTHYTGTTTQTVDSWLTYAFPGWDNNLVANIGGTDIGLVYTVAKVPKKASDGVPNFVAEIKGRKCWDPSLAGGSGDYAWTRNPALILADYLTNTVYGRGRSIDWDSVSSVAGDNNDTTPGETRRLLDLVMDRRTEADNWSETLRVYAGCFIAEEDGAYKLVSDRPASVSRSLTDSDMVAKSDGSPDIKISLRGVNHAPTVIRVDYTDKTKAKWTTRHAYAKASGVDEGTTEWRLSTVRLPGITRYSQAYREAIERLNALSLTDLDVSYVTHDEALEDLPGDIVSITSSRGLTSKQCRVTKVEPIDLGRWRVYTTEYNSNVYSDEVQEAPEFDNTDLPSPFDLPAVQGIDTTEEFELHGAGDAMTNGLTSRLRVSWAEPDYDYTLHYQVQLVNTSGYVVSDRLTPEREILTDPVYSTSAPYTVMVRIVSTVGINGPWGTLQVDTVGELPAPDDVTNAELERRGSMSWLIWDAVADETYISGYKIKYNRGTSTEWGSAETLYEGLHYSPVLISEDYMRGTATFLVKAVTLTGSESVNSASVTINLGDHIPDNVVIEQDEHEREFVGGITNGTIEVATGDLVADTEATLYMWAQDVPGTGTSLDDVDMWATDDTGDMWRSTAYKQMVYEFSVTGSTWPEGTLLVLNSTITPDAEQIIYKPEYDSDWYTGYTGSAMWSGDANLMWNATDTVDMWSSDLYEGSLEAYPPFTTWPGSVVMEDNHRYTFRVYVREGATQGRISALKATIDAPDMIEFIDDVAISSSGDRVILTKDFTAITAVNLTLQEDGGTAAYARVIDKDETIGPLVRTYNTSSTQVAGTVDAIVKGY